MSARVPRSTPCVGSSRRRIEDPAKSQRASSAFCWLPPESRPMGMDEDRALILSFWISSPQRRASSDRFNTGPFLMESSAAMEMFSVTAMSGRMPTPLRSSVR